MAGQNPPGKPAGEKPAGPAKPAAGNAGKAADKANEKKSRKPRVQKTYAPVSLGEIKATEVSKELETKVIPGRERSAEQKYIDGLVVDLVRANIKAGLPSAFRDMPKKAITVPPAQAETVRFMLGKAGTHLNARIKLGRPTGDDGKEIVSFSAIPRDPNQWVDEADEDEGTDLEDEDGDDEQETGAGVPSGNRIIGTR